MDRSSRADGSTTASVARSSRRGAIVGRNFTTAILAVVVLAGLFGLLGDRSSTVRTSDGDVALTLTYPPVVRGGMNVPWQFELSDPDGLPDQVEITIDAAYFDLFEHQRFYPEPAEEHRDGDGMVMTFDTGGATSLVVAHDSYVQPRYSAGRSGSIAVEGPGLAPLSVQFRTVVLP